MKKFLALLFVIVFIGCGYKPMSKVVDNVLDDNIFVDVVMSKTDPQNTVAIKDFVRLAIVSRLHKNLAPKQTAQTYLIASIQSIYFTPLTYDRLGYITSYEATVSINFKTKLKDGTIFSKTTSGSYSFKVAKLTKYIRNINSIVSDQDRYEAIQNSSTQAFDEFIAMLAMKGYKQAL